MDPRFWQLLIAAEVSTEKGRALIKEFGPSTSITQADFAAHPLLTESEAARARKSRLTALDACLADGVEILHGESLPTRLANAEGAPLALFAQGDVSCLSGPCVAIVGTRNASTYGKEVARKFAAALASAGATVVSGGAHGIDTAAHEGVLSVGGRTAAVFAGGIDKPYPARNRALFRRIRERGCLVSEFACGKSQAPRMFLLRNEVIAGLSDAVLVVEAPAKSGALSTAHAARRLGRPVFVTPANINLESFRGSHALIRTGAGLVDDPHQLAEAMGLKIDTPKVEFEPATGLAAAILSALTTSPQSAEKLAQVVDISPQELLGELTMLELEGRVLRDLGGYALVP